MRKRKPGRHHHHVYVVELSDAVWNEPSFRRANPDYRLGKPFVYVGMTGLDPDLRFMRLTSDIIRVPSADELKKGAKIEVLKPKDVEKAKAEAAKHGSNAPGTGGEAKKP